MTEKKFRVLVEDRLCKGCGICVKFCPGQVLELMPNGKLKIIREEDCIGCKTCEIRCPDFAISVEVVQ